MNIKLLLTLTALGVVSAASAQTCNESIKPTTPTGHFVINDNGTVRHRTTGLIWMRCPFGQYWNGAACAGTITTMNWQEALLAVGQLNADGGFAGKTDWRLPNLKELSSIVERRCIQPAFNTEVFPFEYIPNATIYHWSSTATDSPYVPCQFLLSQSRCGLQALAPLHLAT